MNEAHSRIYSIDIARGIIMVIMALDHVRDFIHVNGFDPTDLSKTNTVLFFTRWITHFCMPTFVFLSGVAININLFKKGRNEISIYLLTRGVWLIVLELIVFRFLLFFNFYYDVTILGVLWVFGACMILLSALIYLPRRALLALGVIITLGHDLLGVVPVGGSQSLVGVWSVLTNFAVLNLSPHHLVIGSYPLIPWLGVMLLGYATGPMYTGMDRERRHRKLMQLGLFTTAAFVALRFVNLYGDPSPWTVQKDNWFTFLSFLNTTKYPVSLSFTLMTLGPLFLLLAFLEQVKTKSSYPFLPIGRVPLFYFIVHFFLIHIFALLISMLRTGKSLSEIDFHFANSFGGITPDGRISLIWVYIFWVGIILILYPLCKWYDAQKSTHRKWWMSYL